MNRINKENAASTEDRTGREIETAIYFARMWGVMETLEPVPVIDQREMPAMMLAWAREFILSEKTDEVSFFLQKTEEWKKSLQS